MGLKCEYLLIFRGTRFNDYFDKKKTERQPPLAVLPPIARTRKYHQTSGLYIDFIFYPPTPSLSPRLFLDLSTPRADLPN